MEVVRPADLPPGVRAAMTTRGGGVSRAPYDTLNLGYHVGDDPGAVAENRRRAAAEVGLPEGRAAFGEQVHGNRTVPVTIEDRGRGWENAGSAVPAADALYTTDRGVAVGILVADCFPVAVWDAEAGVLGVAHCGWRGTAAGLPGRLVAEMARETALQPERCGAWIGAGIGICCFQVGPEVIEAFPGIPSAADGPDRWRIDLAREIRRQLVDTGITPARIGSANACTACRSDRLFSHRRAMQQGLPATGRQALFAWLE